MYKHPGEFPMGMDPDNFYEPCFPHSGADYGYMAVVAADMYHATKDESYLKYVADGADGLCSMEMYDGIVNIWKEKMVVRIARKRKEAVSINIILHKNLL